MKNEFFSNKNIDAIEGDITNNYFTPVLCDILSNKNITAELKKICDVGCGNGLYSAFFKREFICELYGVDGSKYALEKAKILGFDQVQHIEDLSKNKLPFDNDTFDLVINKDVLEHLLNPENLIHEISRITKPKKFVLIHVPNHFTIIGRLKLLFFNTIDPFSYFPDEKRWNFPHIRFFTKSDLVELISENGLDIVMDLSHHFFRIPKLTRFIPKSVKIAMSKWNADAFCEGYTILAQKL